MRCKLISINYHIIKARVWKPAVIAAVQLIFLVVKVNGQGPTINIVPPTPNATKITEFHAQHPNMYTGTANVSIPLHTIDFDGWQLPLSISYNATGIRPNEEAGEVGLGWALNATGIISRTIQGTDDLWNGMVGTRGYVYNNTAITFDFGYEHWKFPIEEILPSQNSYYKELVTSKPDTQADIFNYNFFGYSGSFMLSQKAVNPSENIKVLKLTEDATAITFNETGQTFSIITPSGYKGEFTVKEKSTTFSATVTTTPKILCCGQDQLDMTEMRDNSGRFRTTTSWYLSKITSPQGRVITFNYDLKVVEEGNSIGSTYPIGSSYSPYLSNSKAFAEIVAFESENVDQTQNRVPTCLQTVQEHVYLKSIVSDEIQIDFVMEDREDLRKNYLFAPDSNVWHEFPASLNLKRYHEIDITGLDPSSTLSKTIIFTQNYFNQHFQDPYPNNQNEREVRWLRSRLDRLKINDQEYQFTYEYGNLGLPSKLTTGVDHFGFYNGQDSNIDLLPPYVPNYLGSSANIQDTALLMEYSQRWERRVDFDYGKAGLLSKVKYPTQGYTIFEYEPHTYYPDQTPYFYEKIASDGPNKAGGARIKSIREYDYTGNVQLSKNYFYVDDPAIMPSSQNLVTGKLMTPLFNRYPKINYGPPPSYPMEDINYLYRSFSRIPGNSSAEGKIIGYSKVHEVVYGATDSYRNTYYFENRPNEILIWNSIALPYPTLNGQVTEVRNYDSQGKIVQHISNQDYYHVIDSLKAIIYEPIPNSEHFLYYLIPYTIKRTFNTPYTVVTTTASTPSGIVEDQNGNITTWGSITQTREDLTYNKFLPKSQQTTASNGEIIRTEYKRPSDFETDPPTALPEPLNFMLLNNIVDPVIEEVTTRNGQTTAATGNKYELQFTNKVNLKARYTFNKSLGSFAGSSDGVTFNSPYEKSVDFSLYDQTTGKLLEYTPTNGITHSFIWGYNGRLPIAQGVGLSRIQLKAAYDASISSGDYENQIRNHSNTIGKLVTTYQHDPLVGVTKVTDPAGSKTSYVYDSYGRLERVVDNDDKTQSQYEYHFRERQPTRILSLSGNVDFGILTPDMYDPQFLYYERCSDELLTKVLTLTNTGEDDLVVSNLTVPAGFISSWHGGTISPNTSVNVVISFNGAMALGNYSGVISITSNKTNTVSDVTASVVYTTRICDVAVSPTVVDFGITTGSFLNQYLTITNNGNAPIRLIGVPLGWDGISTDYWTFTYPDFSLVTNSNCLGIGQSMQLMVNFVPKANGFTTTKLSLPFDECSTYRDIVTLKGEKRPVNFTIIMGINPSPKTLAPFSGASTSETVTVSNSGTWPLTVSSVNSSNAMFTVSPSSFVVPENGGQQQVTVTYTPTAYNFSSQSTTLTFNSDKTAGTSTVSVTGQRTQLRTIQLSTNTLEFELTGQQKTVTITNVGNEYLNISGISYPSTPNWSASITPANLAPGQSTTMTIVRLTNPNPETLNISVTSNKNGGNEVLQVSAQTRNISISNVTFPSFTSATSSQTATITNSGNYPLTISNITSTNGKFTVSPTSLTVNPGTSQNVTITYTPTDFTQQTSTLSFQSNATSGTGILNVSAQRTQLAQLSVTPSAVYLKPWTPKVTIYITNTGNVNATISSVANNASAYFKTSYRLGTFPTTIPQVLQPGQQLQIDVETVGGNYSSASGTLTINNSVGSPYYIGLSRSTF